MNKDKKPLSKTHPELAKEAHGWELFGKKQNELVAVESANDIRALNSENESGPCRDRTDDPQIKSSSQQDHPMPE